MSQHLEKLMFQVGLIDMITHPVAKIQQQMNQLTDQAKTGFMQMGVGAAGLAGVGYAMKVALEPAIEMDRALGEVKSLGVLDSELESLNRTALDFSVKYGKSADEFVRSSYDIQSAIGGLANGELATFTNASGVLAAATKADTSTITSYMGTMYGIFKDQANAMGKSEWVEQLAGQTAQAVEMFKTTGQEMASAFTSLGANAQSAGIGMSEQIAVLGTLQATMSGSEAGTKYRAFLSGVGAAQDKLGLQFTDSQGRMLPMLDILTKLKGQFGDTFDVAESDALKKAFGSDEAVGLIKLLMNDTTGLAASMDKLGHVKGMDKAQQMAMAMVDPWERFDAGIKAVQIRFGQTLLPVINPVIESFADGLNTVQGWVEMFPHLSRALGTGFMGVLGLSAAMAAFTLLSGLATTAIAGFRMILVLVKTPLLLIRGAMLLWNSAIRLVTFSSAIMRAIALTGVVVSLAGATMAVFAYRGALLLWHGTIKLLTMGMMAWQGVIWLVNAALMANPIVLIVLGVAALIAAVAAAVYWWDDLKAAFMETTAFAWLSQTFASISQAFSEFIGWISDTWNFWAGFVEFLGSIDIFKMLGESIDWLIDKINLIPGIDIGTDTPDIDTSIAQPVTPELDTDFNELNAPKRANVGAGGIGKEINTALTQNSSRTNNIQIHTSQPMGPEQIHGWMAMNAP